MKLIHRLDAAPEAEIVDASVAWLSTIDLSAVR
jgi:hypothetical protein